MSGGFIQSGVVSRGVGVLTLILVVLACSRLWDKDGTWPFWAHPICMTLSFAVFMPLGLLTYFTGKLNGTPREESRGIHALFMGLSALFAFLGWLCIFISHRNKDPPASHFAVDSPTGNQIHVWCGYSALLGVVIQATSGIIKRVNAGTPMLKWHGLSGLPTYAMGNVTIFVACTLGLPWMTYYAFVPYITAILLVVGCALVFYIRREAKMVDAKQGLIRLP